MHLDISRDTFDPNERGPQRHRVQIFQEQGRVLLDAALNHQMASLLHEMRALATDMYGHHWGPVKAGIANGFFISDARGGTPVTVPTGLEIGAGNYYVDGYRCECPEGMLYSKQPFFPFISDADTVLPAAPYVVYLDVWERLLTDISEPELRDPALEQLDAPATSQLVWQVKCVPVTPGSDPASDLKAEAAENQGVVKLQDLLKADARLSSPLKAPTGTLRVMPVQGVSETASLHHADLCESEIDQRYRGLENQLYRIEIHQSGLGYGKEDDADKTSNDIANCAKFKWSRDNGSVIFPVLKMSPKGDHASVQLARVGRDARFSLKAGDWVEYYDEITILRDDLVESSDRNIFRKLLQIESVDAYDPTLLTLKGAAGDFDPPPTPPGWPPEASRPFLRRWDQRPARHLDSQSPMDSQQIRDSSDPVRSSDTNGLLVIAGPDLPTSTSTREEIEKLHKALNVGWLEIENGIRIRFSPGFYRRGDYWLIPARYATGRVLWPTEPIDPARSNLGMIPADQPPRTTEHHYAPLAVVAASGTPVTDCRRIVTPASLPACP